MLSDHDNYIYLHSIAGSFTTLTTAASPLPKKRSMRSVSAVVASARSGPRVVVEAKDVLTFFMEMTRFVSFIGRIVEESIIIWLRQLMKIVNTEWSMGDGAQRLALWDMSTLTSRRERRRRRTPDCPYMKRKLGQRIEMLSSLPVTPILCNHVFLGLLSTFYTLQNAQKKLKTEEPRDPPFKM